jgi:hypothetical protein
MGYGTRSERGDADLKNWDRYNRMGGAFRAATGHAYPAIINRNKAEFEQHPEYFAILADGQRDTNRVYQARKFCVSNQGLIQLCIADAFRQFEASKETMMVSLDPSDSPGSCECDDCKKLGTISDRVFHLANRVAKAVGEKYPGKWVGLYAYSSHQLPTNLKLEPNLYVMVATAFNSIPFTTDELIEQWGKRVTRLGIREYYGVMAWEMDMPGRPRGARIAYLKKSIPHFHKLGANAITAEATPGMINCGLGHYLAAKLMWDTKADVAALTDDFFAKCFGKARAPIEELFQRWQSNTEEMPASHDLAVWLKLADKGAQLAGDVVTRERVDQIKMYLHYLALYHDYRIAVDEKEELKAFEEMMRYTWRVRDLGVCASDPLARRLANSKAPTPEHKWNAPNCVWRDETPVTREELEQLVRADLARYKEIEGVKTVAYSNTFRPLDAKEAAVFTNSKLRGPHEFVIQIPTNGATLQVASDFIYRRGVATTVRLFPLDAPPDDDEETPIFEHKLTGDRAFHGVPLNAVKPGIYRMTIEDRRSGFVLWPGDGVRLTIRAEPASKVWATDRADFYCYVPKETTKFIVIGSSAMTLQKPDGEKMVFRGKQPLREIAVKPGEEGVWQIRDVTGRFHLRGIPPFVGYAPQQMLIPEVAR